MNGVPQTPGEILPGMHMYLFPVLQPKHPISAGYAFFRIRELTTGSNRVLAGIAPNTFICKEWFVIVLIATSTMKGAAPCPIGHKQAYLTPDGEALARLVCWVYRAG